MALIASTSVRSPNGHSAVTSPAINSTGATLIVVSMSREDVELPTLTDSQSNTWTALTEKTTGGRRLLLFYCSNPSVGASHTFTIGATGSNVYPTIGVGAFDAVVDFANENGATHASGTTLQPGAVTPTNATALVVTAAQTVGSSNFFAIDSGFTVIVNLNEGSFSDSMGLAYKVESIITTENPTWTFSNSALGVAVIASFVSGAPPGPEDRITQLTLEIAGSSTQSSRATQLCLEIALCSVCTIPEGCGITLEGGSGAAVAGCNPTLSGGSGGSTPGCVPTLDKGICN